MATSVSYVIVILDTSIVNVALNKLASAFGVGIDSLQWVVNAYTLMFASLLLTGGALGDRWGARRVYLAGLVTFMLASSGCAVAGTLAWLVGARALQGIGAALLVPCSLKLIHQACPAPGQRARAIGIWAGLGGVAMAAGPLIGGLLMQWLDWRALFLVNVPICLAGIAMAHRIAPASAPAASVPAGSVPTAPTLEPGRASDGASDHAPGCVQDPAPKLAPATAAIPPTPLDLVGLACGVLALGTTIGILIEGRVLGWMSPSILIGAAAAAAAWATLFRVEARHAAPMLPPSLFRNRLFSASVHLSLVSAFAFYGLLFVISLYYQQARGYTPLQAGLALLPMTAMVGIGNMSASALTARYGRKWPTIAALAGYAAGATGFGLALSAAAVPPATSAPGPAVSAMASAASAIASATCAAGSTVLTLCSLLVIGLAAGVITPLATAPALETVAQAKAGMAAAVLNTGRQAGAALGVAIFGAILGAVEPVETGMRMALGVVVMACLTAIPVWSLSLKAGHAGATTQD
ncbi:MFS transporter [Achromobacter aloeverae]|uniref:MFS transporter n=2 Tax=Achromobacter aloeverae TaxID=1750518 RepID=A0A4Q1HPM2_9BURK|nr:MFS transporter [Achromobacter aloeverae]